MPPLTSLLARLSVRLRVTLAFALVMALLLAATGSFIYLRLGHDLNRTVDQGLRSRAGDVTALVKQADSGLAQAGRSPLTEQGESLAQILDRSGRVVDAPPLLRHRPLLTPAELRRATRRTLVVEHSRSPLGDGEIRLLATAVTAQDDRLVVVVGASLAQRDRALDNLAGLLFLGGGIALLLASLAGYGAATGALRPVESMRRRAREIQASEPGRRLPVPPSRDEVARLGETLNEMLGRLEDALARERTFVSDASHELRMPLAVLKAELELARDAAVSEQDLRVAVTSASEETDRLVRLAEDLLVIARSQQGGLPVQLSDVDVRELVSAVRQRFERHARDRDATLSANAPSGLRIDADPLHVGQALGNLVDNALRSGARAVEIAAVSTAARVELHVRDDGPGFPPEFLPSAFERFTRADPARGRGGAGLGLAIVAAVAQAHGGAAHARNAAGGGADVWLELPLEGG